MLLGLVQYVYINCAITGNVVVVVVVVGGGGGSGGGGGMRKQT